MPRSHLPPRAFKRLRKLPQALTVDGNTYSPSIYGYGNNVTTSVWPLIIGGNAPIQEGGPSVSINQATDFKQYKGVLFNNGDYYSCSNSTIHTSLTTNDFVVECIVNPNDALGIIFGTYDATNGWYLQNSFSTTSLRFGIIDNGAGFTQLISNSITFEQWYHVMIFLNRNDEGVATAQSTFFINGVAAGNGSSNASDGDCSSTIPLRLGAYAGDVSNGDILAHVAIWNITSGLSNAVGARTNWATIAATRYAKLIG